VHRPAQRLQEQPAAAADAVHQHADAIVQLTVLIQPIEPQLAEPVQFLIEFVESVLEPEPQPKPKPKPELAEFQPIQFFPLGNALDGVGACLAVQPVRRTAAIQSAHWLAKPAR
jgi:hypothetical protein